MPRGHHAEVLAIDLRNSFIASLEANNFSRYSQFLEMLKFLLLQKTKSKSNYNAEQQDADMKRRFKRNINGIVGVLDQKQGTE